MRLVVVESPFAGDVVRNVAFAEAICRYAALNGCAPLASHLLYTRFLNDDTPNERSIGIQAGLAWARHADEAWFCLRKGETMTKGMLIALDRHRADGREIWHRVFSEDGEPVVTVADFAGA